jgi:ketosteroid isomerase-like protein
MLLWSAGTAAHAPDSPGAASPAEVEILAARESIRTAVAAKDAAALRQLYTDDFTHTHGSGKVRRPRHPDRFAIDRRADDRNGAGR